jgi:flavodoxin
MKGLVIYDSLYGNTQRIAQAVAEGLSGAIDGRNGVPVVAVSGVDHPDQLAGLDLLVVGGPTHGSNPSPPMHEFLTCIPDGTLAGVRVAAFDTRADMDTLTGALRLFGKFLDRLGYAAPKISTRLKTKGGLVVKPPEGFIVLGTEGPLREGELERAMGWATQIVEDLEKERL